MNGSLAGRRILVTQSTEFMGPALCEVFAGHGADVVASPEPLAEPSAASRVVREAGRVDVLVANLSVPAPSTPAAEVTDAEWREVFAALADPLPQGRSMLWYAVPIGLVGIAGIVLAIWMMAQP